MKIVFRLRFHTRFGQSLSLAGNHEILGGGRVEDAVPMQYLNPDFWQATIYLPDDAVPDAPITCHYILHNEDGSILQDGGDERILNPAAFNCREVLIIDSWNIPGLIENAFYTEPFQKVLLREGRTTATVPMPPTPTHLFKVKAPLLAKGQTLCLVGNCAALGNWDTTAPMLLNRSAGEAFLTALVDLRRASFPVRYKYGVFDTVQGKFIQYEDGENRVLYDEVAPDRYTVVNDGFVRLPADGWKGAGVAIPVFSLRSDTSFGVGEFSDLKPLADWCRQVGLKLIQILPVNDTDATHTWLDSYPYAAISAFALHPLYLNLNQLTGGKNKPLPKVLEAARAKLNALVAVDYEAVMEAKLKFVRRVFPGQKDRVFGSGEYRDFFEHNRHWLEPYAAFCVLRDRFGTADFNQWPAHRTYQREEVESLLAGDARARGETELNYFIQFHLHQQLKEATEYAHANGVIVKGDIAIGVYRHGADVWQHPELFHTDMQAGAPPDAFSAKGQNWGFPTYHWPRMKRDGFAWWRRRFEQMSCFFDAFRIDHILGFFRIWSSPAHAVEGILGYFVPAIPVKRSEFAECGIVFDHERFTRPLITDEVLLQIFGGDAPAVKQEFLTPADAGRFSLKPGFATQREVEKYFEARESNGQNQKLKLGLFDLISNVILLEVENSKGQEFHFRFAIEDTLSFKDLDPQTRARLKELYVDYFFRRQEEFWKREGMQKLPALKAATNMLICGEDLGLVPACVPEVMKQLGLLSLEIQRMPKALNVEFSRPSGAPYLSVVTPSTHDMSTIRGWWEEDRKLTQKFYNQELGLPGDAPVQCTGAINQAVVEQHLGSPAMWSIFQLQDLLGMDESLRRADIEAERINVPGNPRNYWRYRMHVTLAELQQAATFNSGLKARIGRNERDHG